MAHPRQVIDKAGCEGGSLALRKSNDFSACLRGGFFAPFEALNFAIESSHVRLTPVM
jgi:hypothetical protein